MLLDEEQAVLPGDQDKLSRLLVELDELAEQSVNQQVGSVVNRARGCLNYRWDFIAQPIVVVACHEVTAGSNPITLPLYPTFLTAVFMYCLCVM